MSRKFLFASLSCAALLMLVLGYRYAKEKKKEALAFIKAETMRDLLDEEKFLTKLNQKPPQWMQEQIAEDFAGITHITTEQVDATYAEIYKKYFNRLIVRYRIVNNQLYRYFPKDQVIGTVNCGTEKAMKTLMQYCPFSDMDFILSYEDGIPVPGIASNVHITSDPQMQAPVFFSAKVKDVPYVVLIPDWRSIHRWWAADIKSVLSTMEKKPWDKKKNKAIWRGSLTKAIRLPFCLLSKQYPELLNARINVEERDPRVQEQVESEGLFGGRVSWEEFLDHKYLPILDGGCCAAPAFQWRLLSNSLTIKQESDEIQWFYGALKPYEHYVPMKNDCSDFAAVIAWAGEQDVLCKQIAENATAFSLNHLMMEDVCVYFYHVLKHYSSLQSLNRKELESQIKNDPRWVNIHNMRQLNKQAKKHKLKGYRHQQNNP